MNILYVTNLSKNKWAGPNNSVPAQVKAQSLFDNVFIFNQNRIELDEWRELEYFYNLNDFPEQKLDKLPFPFNRPDLIIFEGMYHFGLDKFVKNIRKQRIPYIIIPRSELTKQAQKQKFLKKKIANLIYFKKLAKNALAIQYLTESEFIDSGNSWNKNNIIIPNGIYKKDIVKSNFNKISLRLVYIGRLDKYHKGLDIMMEAIGEVQNDLRDNLATVHLYGPDRNDTVGQLKKIIAGNGINDIVFIHDSVFGTKKERVLLDADVFFMTSRFEGHPMGLIEALSYGLPCVVTSGTNMSKEIEEISAGWISDTNVDSVKEALVKLLKEKDTLQNKSLNALKLSYKYNWDRLSKISHEKYDCLLKGEYKNESNETNSL